MKLNYFIINIVAIIGLIIYVIISNSNEKDSVNKILEEELKKRDEFIKKIDSLKIEKKYLDLSIEEMKKYVDKKDKDLYYNIQEVKSKNNVQVRNVTDSSFLYLLNELRTN